MSETTNQTIYSGYQLHYSILSWIHRVCQTSPGFLIGRSCVNHQQNCCSTYDTTWWKLNRSWNHSLLILLLKWFKCPFLLVPSQFLFWKRSRHPSPTGHVKNSSCCPTWSQSLARTKPKSCPKMVHQAWPLEIPEPNGGRDVQHARFDDRRVQEGTPKLCLLVICWVITPSNYTHRIPSLA